MDATMWHRDQTNCRRCLLILNGLRVLMEWAWLFCTSHHLQSIYLSISHPHSDDATLSLGLETMMHATFVITPLVTFFHTACAFFVSAVLFFHFWVVPSSGFSKSLFGNPSSSNCCVWSMDLFWQGLCTFGMVLTCKTLNPYLLCSMHHMDCSMINSFF